MINGSRSVQGTSRVIVKVYEKHDYSQINDDSGSDESNIGGSSINTI